MYKKPIRRKKKKELRGKYLRSNQDWMIQRNGSASRKTDWWKLLKLNREEMNKNKWEQNKRPRGQH